MLSLCVYIIELSFMGDFAENCFKQRRFPCAVRPYDSSKLSTVNMKIDSRKKLCFSKADSKIFYFCTTNLTAVIT